MSKTASSRKKTPRIGKISPIVLVAFFALVGTIITAVANSEVIIEWLKKLSAPTTTSIEARPVEMRCVEEEKGATLDGTVVPVSVWSKIDCSYSTPSALSGQKVVLTTWGLSIEYAGSRIVKARIIHPNVPIDLPKNSSLFAGYQSQEAAVTAYITANPNEPTPIP